MKSLRINAAMFAMVLGVTTAFAFKAPAIGTTTKAGTVWYKFNGGDPSSPASYSRMSGTPTCNGSAALCAIQGNDDGIHPSQATVNAPSDQRNLQ